MSELDKLRELLDEAGVSYLNHRSDVTIGYYSDDPHSVIEAMDHSLQVTGLTAEQVIRALGTETCHADETETIYASRYDSNGWTNYHIHVMECSECGRTYEHVNGDYEYCPHCGRRIEKDDE